MNKLIIPLILAVALGLLAIVAGAMAFTFPKLEDITNVTSTIPTGKTPKKLQAEELQTSVDPWNSPAEWKAPEDHHRLFISEGFLFYPSLYPEGDYLKKNDGTARSPGGVLLTWYQKYGIDFTSATVDRDDPDGDGFSNITEFKNEQAKASECDGSKSTNPLDPNSHPTYISRLRLQKYDSRPFHIEFRGYEPINGVMNFQIYLKDIPSAQQPGFKKIGDKLGFEDYIIGPFHQSIVEKLDPATKLKSQVDVSTLELDKPDIGFSIILTYRQPVDSPESTADFVMLMPTEVDKVIKVPRGQQFTVPYITDTKYLLIAVKDDGAVIRNVATKEEITVPNLDPAEWNEVPIAPAATAQPKTP